MTGDEPRWNSPVEAGTRRTAVLVLETLKGQTMNRAIVVSGVGAEDSESTYPLSPKPSIRPAQLPCFVRMGRS